MRALLILIALIMVACGGGQRAAVPGGSATGDGTVVPPNPRDPDPALPGNPSNGPTWTTGATVNLLVPEVNVLEQYTGRPMNFPSGVPITIKFNLSLRDVAEGDRETFGGSARIGYAEPIAGNYYFREALFDAGNTLTESQYNEFQMFGDKLVFRAFLEDQFGAILVVIDSVDDSNNFNGSVYFHNFKPTYASKPPPPTGRCWFIKVGPYECRDFLVGSGNDTNKQMNTGASIYPTRLASDGAPYFVKLGTFTGLEGNKAFGN